MDCLAAEEEDQHKVDDGFNFFYEDKAEYSGVWTVKECARKKG